MLKSLKKFGIVIVRELAIAFFFTALVVLGINYFFSEKINNYLKLFNKVAISTEQRTEHPKTNITIDSDSRKLTNIPAYGELFGKISIPDINANLNLYNGDSLKILKMGAGRYIGAFFPGEGKPIVLAGHNTQNYFANLHKLKKGAKIIIKTDYGTFEYENIEGKIMTPEELNSYFDEFISDESEEKLLIYTCYPTGQIGYRYKRYVIIAKKIKGEYLWKQ